MSFHNDVGNFGEARAATYLLAEGYQIIHQGWRHKRWELDIIATKEDVLHFIEVKTRTSSAFTFPEQAVTAAKMRKLKIAANEYCRRFGYCERVQFDVIAIMAASNGETQIEMFCDVWL
jgi:putative endonuclease